MFVIIALIGIGIVISNKIAPVPLTLDQQSNSTNLKHSGKVIGIAQIIYVVLK